MSSIGLGGQGITLFVWNVVMLILTWITVSLRIWTRAKIIKNVGLDDWFMIACILAFTWMSVTIIVMAFLGFGRHLDTLPLSQIVTGFELALLTELAYSVTLVFLRLSVVFLYFRLVTARWQKILLWVIAAVNVIYNTCFFFISLLQCDPISYTWTQYEGAPGNCHGAQTAIWAAFGQCALSVLSDWILALLPVILLRKAKLNFKTKIIVCGLLGLGIIASVASIVRFSVLHLLLQTADFTYTVTPAILWTSIEASLGILAANIWTFRPLFKSIIDDPSIRGGFTISALSTWRSRRSTLLGGAQIAAPPMAHQRTGSKATLAHHQRAGSKSYGGHQRSESRSYTHQRGESAASRHHQRDASVTLQLNKPLPPVFIEMGTTATAYHENNASETHLIAHNPYEIYCEKELQVVTHATEF